MSDQSRRKLLKSIAAGSGAIVAGKSLPDSWSKPIVDSVMLPAHAQTSQVVPVACRPDPAVVDFNGGVGIIFDGNTCSTYIGQDDEDIQSDDVILYLDNDTSNDPTNGFEINVPHNGANWSNLSEPPADQNYPVPGTYSYTFTRLASPYSGNSYELTFTAAFANPVMTIRNISIVQV